MFLCYSVDVLSAREMVPPWKHWKLLCVWTPSSVLRPWNRVALPPRAVCSCRGSPGIWMSASLRCCPLSFFLAISSPPARGRTTWGVEKCEEQLPTQATGGTGQAWRGWNVVFKARHFALVPEFRHPTPPPSSPLAVQSNHAPALWQLPDAYVLLITDVCSLQVSY